MRILIRDQTKKWTYAESVKAEAEAELQKLLVESPSLINIDEIREGTSPLVFAVSEFGLPGSGATDVISFSAEGDIALVECKLATNPEIKRKVIGQILEYAAYLWQMSYEEVDSRIQQRVGKPLAALIVDSVAGDWDEEQFRSGVKQSLDDGSFILIIVVDELNDELRRIIRYINECSESAFSLHALEMRRFQAEGIEVLVPHVYGISTKPPVGGKRAQWTQARFFELFKEQHPESLELVRDVYNWSQKSASRVYFGAGKKEGSFTYHYLRDGVTYSVFTIYTYNRLSLNYGWLSPKVSEDVMNEFHSKIQEIPTFSHIARDFTKWPTVKVEEAFSEDEYLENFKNIVTWLQDRIDSDIE